MTIDENIKAAIIGLWRQGNKYEIISHITDVSVYDIDKIISEYLLKKNFWSRIYPINLN